jgi:DNA-directed RNA polymerase I, II, and III subunit RPABC3
VDDPANDLMASYDYVMSGKVFKYADNSSAGSVRVEVYVSFGGLLMKLVGDPSKLEVLTIDSRIFLLMRKLG